MNWREWIIKLNNFFNKPEVIIFLIVFGVVEGANYIAKDKIPEAILDITISVYWFYRLRRKM